MNLQSSRKLVRVALGAAVATAFSAAAQQTILFSKPTENPEDKANSFMLDSGSKLQGRAGDFNAPKQLFNLAPDQKPGPMVAPPVMSQSLKDALDKRKNWTLMTPQEILGVPTAEKIMGLPDPTGDDKRTPEERFLRRQNLGATLSATNALRRPEALDDANPFTSRAAAAANDPFAKPDPRLITGSRKYFDQLINAPADSPFGADQNPDPTSSFGHLAPLPKPDLAQIAAMDRFRALMEPSAPPEKMTADTRFSTAPVLPAANPNLQPVPLFNPLGQSYTPLQSGIGRPTGILPLPGLTASPPPAAPKKPLVQLPPWMSKEPPPLDGPFGQVNTRTW